MFVLQGASPNTLMGLSGVGDTFGTCFGPLSRNRNLGIRLGQGPHTAGLFCPYSRALLTLAWYAQEKT